MYLDKRDWFKRLKVYLVFSEYDKQEWEACEGLEIPVEEYEKAKQQIAGWEEEGSNVQIM